MITNDFMFQVTAAALSNNAIQAKWEYMSAQYKADLKIKFPNITQEQLNKKLDSLAKVFSESETELFKQKLNNAKTRTNLTEALNDLFGCPRNTRNYPIWKKENAPVEDVSLTSAPNPQAKKDLFLNYMNQAVAQKKPVAISYLTNGLISVPSQNHGRHASLIVGRKSVVVNGKAECHYIVRNSWGESWPGDRLTNLKAKRAFDQKGVALPGHFMVSERDLVEHLTAYTKVPFAE
jgi:RNAse (barnase) inhibitor barstar